MTLNGKIVQFEKWSNAKQSEKKKKIAIRGRNSYFSQRLLIGLNGQGGTQ